MNDVALDPPNPRKSAAMIGVDEVAVEKHPADEVDTAAAVADVPRDFTQFGVLDPSENDDGCEHVAGYPRGGTGDDTLDEREVVGID